jgi:hypothetical protein
VVEQEDNCQLISAILSCYGDRGGAAHLLPAFASYATYIALAPMIGGEAAVQVVFAAKEEP